MTAYTEEGKLPLLDSGSSDWLAVFNGGLSQIDQGLALTCTCMEGIEQYAAVSISDDNEVRLAKADDAAKRPAIGLALTGGEEDEEIKVLYIGWVDYDDSEFGGALGASAGNGIYLSTTVGRISTTPTSTYPQLMGFAKTSTATHVTRVFILPNLLVIPESEAQEAIDDVAEASESNTIDNAAAINKILATLRAAGIIEE